MIFAWLGASGPRVVRDQRNTALPPELSAHRPLSVSAKSVGSREPAFEFGLQPDQFFWVVVGTVLGAGAPWMAQASLIRSMSIRARSVRR